MRKYRGFSLKVKIPVIVGIAGLAIILVGCVLLMIPLRLTSLSNISKIAKLQCQETGAILSLKINTSADVVRNYSYLIAHLAASDLIPKENKRAFMLSEMEIRYRNEKALNNVWCTFEPNALDGMDAHYINSQGSNEFGVFQPWFAEGDMATSPTIDYESIYYIIPKETRRDVVIDPYWDQVNGKNTLMISFVSPILLNDTFLGVLGTDFYIDDLHKLIAAPNIVGSSKLVTDKGIIVIHENPELIGKSENCDQHEFIMNRLAKENIFDQFDTSGKEDIYRVCVPVYSGENDKPWVYVIEIPAVQIYAEARKIVGLLAIIFVLLVLSVSFFTITIMKNRELKKLHVVKDKIFSLVAHDLRSPMGALATTLKLAEKNRLDPETQAQLFKDISNRVDNTFSLLDNLLRWAKSQMKGMVSTPVYFDVQEESFTVTNALQYVAENKGITIDNHIEKHQVYADRDMFAVVVRNLTANALKFTFGNGTITLDSELSDGMLVVSVKDTGIGMSQEVQEKLFQLSEIKSRRGTNNESGTGLGLVLSADFVKANGGRIWFTSVQGKGSTFFFSVPVKN